MRRIFPTLLVGAFAASAVAYLGWSLWRVYGNRMFTGRSVANLSWENLEALEAPVAISADQVTTLDDDDLVVGVVRDGQARAYSIRYLNPRGCVNDSLGGSPLCATW